MSVRGDGAGRRGTGPCRGRCRPPHPGGALRGAEPGPSAVAGGLGAGGGRGWQHAMPCARVRGPCTMSVRSGRVVWCWGHLPRLSGCGGASPGAGEPWMGVPPARAQPRAWGSGARPRAPGGHSAGPQGHQARGWRTRTQEAWASGPPGSPRATGSGGSIAGLVVHAHRVRPAVASPSRNSCSATDGTTLVAPAPHDAREAAAQPAEVRVRARAELLFAAHMLIADCEERPSCPAVPGPVTGRREWMPSTRRCPPGSR